MERKREFFFIGVAVVLVLTGFVFRREPLLPLELSAMMKAYSDAMVSVDYDDVVNDWAVTLKRFSNEGREKETEETAILYWAQGRLLPIEKCTEMTSYAPVISYRYPRQIIDPAKFTPKQLAGLKKLGDPENRASAPPMAPFFFNWIYRSSSREELEQNIVRVDFLKKRVTVHNAIEAALKRVEERIHALEKKDSTVRDFVQTLSIVDGYMWRDIRDSASRSFHSWALAVDILPQNWQKEILYWNWARASGNSDWMLIPLSKRWIPPAAFIKAFEAEGFIWGGKWGLWDNMHFEYRPELLLLK